MADDRKGGCLALFLFFIVLSVIIGGAKMLVFSASPEAIKKSKEAIDMYHSALESGKCKDVTKSVSAIDPKDLERLIEYCEALNRKHGNLIKSHSVGSSTVANTSNLHGRSGNFIILDYDSKFSSLSIVERFTWRFSVFGGIEFVSYDFSE
jgi:hypothetical protein